MGRANRLQRAEALTNASTKPASDLTHRRLRLRPHNEKSPARGDPDRTFVTARRHFRYYLLVAGARFELATFGL